MVSQGITDVHEFVASANVQMEAQSQSPPTVDLTGQDAGEVQGQHAVSRTGPPPVSGVTTGPVVQPVQQTIPLPDLLPHKAPPPSMPTALFPGDRMMVPPTIGGQAPRTDPVAHQMSLQQMNHPSYIPEMPTPPMSGLAPRAPNPNAVHRECAQRPPPVPSSIALDPTPQHHLPPGWAVPKTELRSPVQSDSSVDHRKLNMPSQLELMAIEGEPDYDVWSAGKYPWVISKREPTPQQQSALMVPATLWEDQHPAFVGMNSVIEEQDENGTSYKIDRIKFANYLQTMTVAAEKLQTDMQILVWVHKMTHAERLYHTTCHLQSLLQYQLLPVTFFIRDNVKVPASVPQWEKCSTMWHNAPNMALVPFTDWNENQLQHSVISWTHVPPMWSLSKALLDEVKHSLTFGLVVDHIVPLGSEPITCSSHMAIVAFKACTFIQGLSILNSRTVLDSSDTSSYDKARTYCPVRYKDAASYYTAKEYAECLTSCNVPAEMAHEAVVAVAVQQGATHKQHKQCVHAESRTTVALGLVVNVSATLQSVKRKPVRLNLCQTMTIPDDFGSVVAHSRLQTALNKELSKAKEHGFSVSPPRNPDVGTFTWHSGMKLPDKCTAETDLQWVREYHTDMSIALRLRLGEHEDWKEKVKVADEYYMKLCDGGKAWPLPNYMKNPEVLPEQNCDAPLYRGKFIHYPNIPAKSDPPCQSATATASGPPLESQNLSAGGFLGDKIRGWGESSTKRQWDSDGPVTALAWKDLGEVNEDLSFLVPVHSDPNCPPCPLDVQSALKGKDVTREHVQDYTFWIRDWFKVSSHDPRKYCAYCDLMNHPRFACQFRIKHRDQNAQHHCRLCYDSHPTFLCSRAKINGGSGQPMGDTAKAFKSGHSRGHRSQSMGATCGSSSGGKPWNWSAAQPSGSGIEQTVPHSSWAGWQKDLRSSSDEASSPAQTCARPRPTGPPLQTISEGLPGNLWQLDEQKEWHPVASFIRHATEMGFPIRPNFVNSRAPPNALSAISSQPNISSVQQTVDYIEKLQFEMQSCELWSHMIKTNIAKELHRAHNRLSSLLLSLEEQKDPLAESWGRPMEEDS